MNVISYNQSNPITTPIQSTLTTIHSPYYPNETNPNPTK